MKQTVLRASAFALATSLALLPAAALAQENSPGGQGGGVTVGVQGGVQVQTGGEEEGHELEHRGPRESTGSTSTVEKEGQNENEHGDASSGEWMHERAQKMNEMFEHVSERTREILGDDFNFDLEHASTTALSGEELKRMIEQRRRELEQEAASSSPEAQDIIANNDDVRVAVRALLASRELLGGIGQRVSQIAQDVNASLATTTVAEAQIKSRGFIRKFLFGGDREAGEELAQTASSTQQRISELTDLLNQASTTAEVKATLQAQIQAIESTQARIAQLAQQQKGNGLLGWLFH